MSENYIISNYDTVRANLARFVDKLFRKVYISIMLNINIFEY